MTKIHYFRFKYWLYDTGEYKKALSHIMITTTTEGNQFLRVQTTGCSLIIVFFPYNFPIFLPILLQRQCSTCLVCVLTPRENRERPDFGMSSEKTQYLINTLYSIKKSAIIYAYQIQNIECTIYILQSQKNQCFFSMSKPIFMF